MTPTSRLLPTLDEHGLILLDRSQGTHGNMGRVGQGDRQTDGLCGA